MRFFLTLVLMTGVCGLASGQNVPPVQLDGMCPGGYTVTNQAATGYIAPSFVLAGSGFVGGGVATVAGPTPTQFQWDYPTGSGLDADYTYILSISRGFSPYFTYVSPTQVTITLPAADLAAVGDLHIRAATFGPATGAPPVATYSNVVTLSRLAAPVLTSLNPTQTTVGAPLSLNIGGGQFVVSASTCPAATAAPALVWNGKPVAATLTVAPTGVLALIPPALVTPGTVSVAISNPGGGVSNALPLIINPPPVITTKSLPNGVNGTPYTATQISSTGGTQPFAWSLSPANIGLSIDATGTVRGVPTVTGNFTVTISARDGASVVATANYPVTIFPPVQNVPPVQLNGMCPGGYTVTKQGAGGTVPFVLSGSGFDSFTQFQWDFSSANGLTGAYTDIINSTQGPVYPNYTYMSPTQVLITLPAADLAAVGDLHFRAVTSPLTNINIAPATISNAVTLSRLAAPVLSSLNPAQTTAGVPLSLNIGGGQFVVSAPTCPAATAAPALVWNGSPVATTLTVAPTGILALVPPALVTPGTVSVAISNPGGGVSNALPLIINPLPVITTTSLPAGVIGKAYTATQISSTGGTQPLTWSLSPANIGLSIDATGTVGGVPNVSGTFTVTISARDGASVVATANYPVTILSTPQLKLTFSLDQTTLTIALPSVPTAPVTGTLSLAFQLDPAVAANRDKNDPVISIDKPQFSIVPPNQSTTVAVQPGLSAGVLTITASNVQQGGLDITPAPQPLVIATVPPAPPKVDSACIQSRTSSAVGSPGSFTVSLNGSSSTREISRVKFGLTGNRLTVTELDVNNANAIFAPYYSTNFVSFTYTQAFQVDGDVNDISGISVSMENSQGASTPVAVALSCP